MHTQICLRDPYSKLISEVTYYARWVFRVTVLEKMVRDSAVPPLGFLGWPFRKKSEPRGFLGAGRFRKKQVTASMEGVSGK